MAGATYLIHSDSTIGKVTGSSASHYEYKVVWSSEKNDLGNYSDLTIQTYIRRRDYLSFDYRSYNTGGTATEEYTCTGESDYKDSSCTYDTRYDTNFDLLSTKTFRVDHEADGTKQVYISTNFVSNAGSGMTGAYLTSKQITLDRIPRAATISNYENFNIGNNTTLNVSNLGNFNCELKFIAGGVTVKTITGTLSGSISTLIDSATLYGLTPNNNSLLVTAQLNTFNGAVQVGDTQTSTATAYVINSDPLFSDFTFEDYDSETINLTDSNQDIIVGFSDIRATVSLSDKAVSQNFATMDKYRLSIGSKTIEVSWSDSADVILELQNVTPSGTIVKIEAVDSRGNTSTVVKNAEDVLSLTPITITSLIVERDNGSDETAKLNAEGNIDLLNFGDAINSIQSIAYKYKLTTSSTWINGTSTISATVDGNGHFTITDVVISGDLTSGTYGFTQYKSFDIQLLLSDELTDTTYEGEMSGYPAFMILRNDQKVVMSVGGMPTIEEGVQSFGGYHDKNGNNILDKTILQPILLADGTDLDDITEAGMYYSASSTSTATMSNVPTSLSFSLFVEKHGGTKQTLTNYSTTLPTIWIRNEHGDGWSDWFKVSMLRDSGTFTPVFAGDGTAGSFTYTTQSGKYMRQGEFVYVYFKTVISYVSSAPSGNYIIDGFPYDFDDWTIQISGINSSPSNAHDNLDRVVGLSSRGGYNMCYLKFINDSNRKIYAMTSSNTPITTGSKNITIEGAGIYHIN